MKTEFHKLRLLCCIPHYFSESKGKKNLGQWKSVSQDPDVRRHYVEQTISSLRTLESLSEVATVDVQVCGIRKKSLVSLDIEFDKTEPLHVVFETLNWMLKKRNEYDYYLLVEDDILVPKDVLSNIIAFDKISMPNEVFHPNRIEVENDISYNTDLNTYGHWTTQLKLFCDKRLVVNVNPHSALFILSANKFNYCADHANIDFRGLYRIGEFRGGMMASAFANFLSPMSLYRTYDDLTFHYVVHQDKFEPNLTRYEKFTRFMHSFLPQPLIRNLKDLKQNILNYSGVSSVK